MKLASASISRSIPVITAAVAALVIVALVPVMVAFLLYGDTALSRSSATIFRNFGTHFRVSKPEPYGDMEAFSLPGEVVYGIPITVLPNEASRPELLLGVCLDGTPPAIHFNPGRGSGQSKWLVFLEGGAWCEDESACRQRAETDLGSSARMRREYKFHGILSNSSSSNPPFADWNVVYVRYCDGASFSGTASLSSSPKDQGGQGGTSVDKSPPEALSSSASSPPEGLHYAGAAVLERVMNFALNRLGMANATHALLAGDSAGGLAALLHCDRFRTLVTSGAAPSMPGNATHTASSPTIVKCLCGSGFFLDTVDVYGSNSIRPLFSSIAAAHRPRLPQRCLDAPKVPGSDTAALGLAALDARLSHAELEGAENDRLHNLTRCFFPQHFAHFISTPFFIINSLYDTWHTNHILVPTAKDTTKEWAECKHALHLCHPAQLSILQGYRQELIQRVSSALREEDRGQGVPMGASSVSETEAESLKEAGGANGAFLLSCRGHQMVNTLLWHSSTSPQVHGLTMAEAVGAWFHGTRNSSVLVDCPYPCNPTCFTG